MNDNVILLTSIDEKKFLIELHKVGNVYLIQNKIHSKNDTCNIINASM